jgi:hypothetical protein
MKIREIIEWKIMPQTARPMGLQKVGNHYEPINWGNNRGNEDAAGVGIITKQNTTQDVKPGETERNLKKLHLVNSNEDAVIDLEKNLKNPLNYNAIDHMMKTIAKENMDHAKDNQAVPELKAALLARKSVLQHASEDQVYDIIDTLMTRIAKSHCISGQKLHDMWVDQYNEIPDTWIKENFVDGKGPGRPGDSKRAGIPKDSTIAQLKKIRSSKTASPRKKQLAHWQINMRQGRKK